MRIKLTGLISEAHGPFGGEDRANKLVQLRDGTQLVQARKHSVTGSQTRPCHAWMKLCWIVVDAYWKTLPTQVRVEWGKCLKRSHDHARSNLDEFRAINMIRCAVGAGLLRLPPDRFHSYVHYLQNPAHSTKKDSALWLHGRMKPEPPAPGEEPPDVPVEGEPFDFEKASEPNPLVAQLVCFACPCGLHYLEFNHDVYFHGPFKFPVRPGRGFVRWVAQCNLEAKEVACNLRHPGGLDDFAAFQVEIPKGVSYLGANMAVPATGSYSSYFLVALGLNYPVPPAWSAYCIRREAYCPKVTCKDGARMYADRDYTLEDTSPYLVGGELAQGWNDDRLRTDAEYIRITADGPLRLFVLYAGNRTFIPQWLYQAFRPQWVAGANRSGSWYDYLIAEDARDWAGGARSTMKGFPISCTVGPEWEGVPVPWESAWCVHLRYHNPPDVIWSDAYYWAPGPPLPPYGIFSLATFTHATGTYDWDDVVYFAPGGQPLTKDAPCRPSGSVWTGTFHPCAFWLDVDDLDQWAGLRWIQLDVQGADPFETHSWGPAYVSHTRIKCISTSDIGGYWAFSVTVKHKGQPYTLEYRKPGDATLIPETGAYYLDDPVRTTPWATPALIVYDNYHDFHGDDPDAPYRIFVLLCEILAAELIGFMVHKLLVSAQAKLFLGAHYSDDAVRAIAQQAQAVYSIQNKVAWKCQVAAKMGWTGAKAKTAANLAWALAKTGQIAPIIPLP